MEEKINFLTKNGYDYYFGSSIKKDAGKMKIGKFSN